MEQILIRNLPDGTKAALRASARRHDRPLEAEARAILVEALEARAADRLAHFLDSAEGFRAVFGGVELEPIETTDYEPPDPFQ